MHAYYFIFNQQNSKINGNVNKLERRRRSFSVQSNLLNSSLKRQRNLLILTIWWYFLLHCASYPIRRGTIYEMGTKMKGIYKGFKYTVSQIFVVKEREIEIGYPTDVKHVAHIGWDGPSGSAPSWMNQFKSGPDFAATSIGNSGSALSQWSSQDYGGSDMFKETPPTEHDPMKKKQRRKKKPLTSSPKSNSGSSSKSSRAAKVKAKAKAKFVDGNANPTQIEVA